MQNKQTKRNKTNTVKIYQQKRNRYFVFIGNDIIEK